MLESSSAAAVDTHEDRISCAVSRRGKDRLMVSTSWLKWSYSR
jgi:hypothetical protein